MPYLGETAALLTAGCWTFTTFLFSYAVRHVGSFRLNLLRMSFSAVILWVLVLGLWGTGWLRAALPREYGVLFASAWIGLTLGDWAYFQSLDMLGPRVGPLLVTLTPPIAATLGALFLHEHPGPLGLLGMAMTLAGTAWVVLERSGSGAPRGHRIRGVTCGVLSSLATAVAYILSKIGMAGSINPLQASSLRMAAGTAAAWLFVAFGRRDTGLALLATNRRVLAAMIIGSIVGPVTGIWLSLVAIRHTQAGIATTLISLVPVLVLPVLAIRRQERLSWRAVGGALLAVAGVAVLFWRR